MMNDSICSEGKSGKKKSDNKLIYQVKEVNQVQGYLSGYEAASNCLRIYIYSHITFGAHCNTIALVKYCSIMTVNRIPSVCI